MEKAVSSITEVMSIISNALLLPVLVAVLVCLAWTLVSLGGFLREYAGRRRCRRLLAATASVCDDTGVDPDDLWKRVANTGHALTNSLVRNLPARPVAADVVRKRLTDLESEIADALARLSFLTRVGPMLGLLGTLIPLGPALTGLSAGNMQQLSSNLVVAFTATVVGLVASCIAYGIGLVYRGWYGRDMDDLEYIVNRLYPENPTHAAEAKVGP
ncbi:flagellar motor protein : MotA/TolQ/ExbB proton channel OS=Chthoniobacter flavus Ellin428 GN=CfE428DRAFT_2832 PE=3 SV=1: MotA_ExbB [Gemmata massiliana]|uniref:MotA/TolQ/ExbB proton channel domain-containing protein n=1 Tax=Gemmata massiliana TaxID=1210884 RepID=A0A6P2D5V1_9BACT|nr:MotA/TolQ/ExbB proton channel family protein [Gemmata massiliana]VTR96671.1 flagellar motor protein : MotA/TolQ/ExbB proton channel OS=Chthoniobacter flavus Ellin428 GN=CfE428DRAFT_2832 PE=3 SV=1: MotA_ExbB [Gemmata massiliana]